MSENKQKKESQRSAKILIAVLGIVIVAAITLFVSNSVSQQNELMFEYNGFWFKKAQFDYQLQLFINQQSHPTLINIRHKPQEVEDIPIKGDIQGLKKKETIYVAIDPTAELTGKTTMAALEIDKFIDNEFLYNIPVNSAFTKEHEEGVVKTCSSVNDKEGVIILQLGASTEIREEKGCIIVESTDEDGLIRAADRLVFGLLDVIL